MIIESKNLTLKMKIRAKGAPSYAETGINRKATVNGTKVNLVLNPKEGSDSKRVGMAYNNKWYIVDDATAHQAVANLKSQVAFTIKARGKQEETPKPPSNKPKNNKTKKQPTE